ncbi:carbohydrate ABC transporter permease [Microbacterium sp.]|uniref:carbohydrate ABC transporter permease n=1 Tax=Microbacterium sp. TaxID=51671 RepID=UPI003F70001B
MAASLTQMENRSATRSTGASVAAARRRANRVGYIFITPYLVLLAAFGLIPIAYSLYLAFTDGDTGGFVGLDNINAVHDDFRYIPAVQNVLFFLVVWLVPSTVILVSLALLLHNRAGRSASFLRAAYYIPGALAGTASVVLWLFMLSPSVSPFGFLFEASNLTQIFEVVSPSRLPFIIALISFWTGAGGWILVLYGALTSIDPALLEAAKLDGANEWQTIRYVKLPLLRKWIGYLVILNLAAGSQVFVEPQLISSATKDGVATDWSLNQLSYTMAFSYGRFNEAAALSLELLLVGLIGSIVIVRVTGLFKADV